LGRKLAKDCSSIYSTIEREPKVVFLANGLSLRMMVEIMLRHAGREEAHGLKDLDNRL